MSWKSWLPCIALMVSIALVAGCPSRPPTDTGATAVTTPTGGEATTADTGQVASFTWTATPTVDDIPAGAVAGMMNGKPFTAKTVRVQKDDEDTYLLKISDVALDDPNDPGGVITNDDGWEMTFTTPEGQPTKLTWAVADDKTFDNEHVYYWYQQPNDEGPMSVNHPWGAALEITEWNVHEPAEGSDVLGNIKGRFVLVMDDDARSWIGGDFDAPYYQW